MGLFKWMEQKPQRMRDDLLKDAQRRLVEAEHMESRWKHAANQAREEIQRLGGQYNALTELSKSPTVQQVAKSVEEVTRRSFIGQPQR